MAYNKQTWKDEIPDLTKPIKDSSGKQKTDPQTGRPLYELVQEGTRITSARLNHIEDGIEGAHSELADLSENVETHMSDDVKHLTAAERTAWNTKETPAGAQQKADASLASAKSYTETQLLTKADKSTTYSKTETDQRIKAVIGAAPPALDTLKEIGDALNNDPDFAGTMTTQLAGKVDKVSGKQLSTENFSSEEKAKLAGLTTGAGGAGSATDTVIGDRTIADAGVEPTGQTGKLGTVLNWLAFMIRSITGKSSWRAAPATTLEAAKAHADDTTRHITAAERTTWNNKETTAGAQAKADAVQTNLTSHAGEAGPGIHGSTAAATPRKLIHRDDSGRAKVAAPAAADDIARKDTVDNAQAAAIAYTDTKVGRVDLTQTLGPGTSVIQADQNGSELDLTIQGRTLHNRIYNGKASAFSANGQYSTVTSMPGITKYEGIESIEVAYTGSVASSATGYQILTGAQIDHTKYYVFATDIQNMSAVSSRVLLEVGTGTLPNTTIGGNSVSLGGPGQWYVSYGKVGPAELAGKTTFYFHFQVYGAAGQSFQDAIGTGFRLYEVPKAEYDLIGTVITADNFETYYPFVVGRQHIQGVAITKQGRNIYSGGGYVLGNGAGTTSTEDLTTNSMTVTSGAGAYNYMRSQRYAVSPSTTYTLSYTATNISGADNPQISIRKGSDDGASGIVTSQGAGAKTYTFNTGTETEIILYVYGSNGTAAVQTKRYDNIQLELGSAATPFTPAEPQSVILPVALGQLGDIRDKVYSAGAEWMYAEGVKKDIAVSGGLAWEFTTTYTGYKRVRAPLDAPLARIGGAFQRAIKYTGAPLTFLAIAPTAADQFLVYTDTNIYLSIASADSGWTDAVNPSTNAIKALMNGWKANANNGTVYTSWVSVLNGSAPSTNTEAWVAANKAPGWTAWATLDYVLAQAAQPVPVPNAEGSITLHPGGNQISVETGVVQRERVTVTGGEPKYINAGTKMSYPAARILQVYKGADIDNKWLLGLRGARLDPFGIAFASISAADYDANATYYVTYIALDKYPLTANVTETAATWRTGLGGVVSDVVQSVAELRQYNDRQDFADDYIEAKVDNLRLGIADASALPDNIQKYKLTEKTGKPFIITSGSADSLTSTGLYYISTTSNVSGFPTDVASNTAVTLEVLELGVTSSNKSCLQRVTAYASVRVWQRRYNGTDWTAWVEIENTSRKNVAGGYPGLNEYGDVPLATIPDVVQKYSLTKDDGKALTVPAGADLNTLLTIGFYTGNNLLNSPGGSTLWFHILVQTHSGATDGTSYVVQRAISLTDAGTPTEWIRRRVTSNWTAWVSIPNSSLYNVPNGIAGLDANGDLLLTAIPDAVLQGTVSYLGTLAGNSPNFTGSANPPITALVAGQRLSFKSPSSTVGPINLNADGRGAKSIKKPNGNNPTLAQGGVYTVIFDGQAFILQGEGGEYGTAGAAQVLVGYSVGTESGLVAGTMVNRTRGAVGGYTTALSVLGDSGGSLVMEPPTGYYEEGRNAGNFGTLIAVDPNYVPSSILSGRSIFGVPGAVPVINDGADPALGVGRWGDGALAVYPREGYRKGGAGAGEIKVTPAQLQSAEPALISANIRAGASIFGTSGNLGAATGNLNFGIVAPTSATANGISWSLSANIGTGKTIVAVNVYCQASASYYVATSLFSGLRLHQSAAWSPGVSRSSIISSTAGGQVMVSVSGVNYNSGSGNFSLSYSYITSGAGTLSLVGNALGLYVDYVYI